MRGLRCIVSASEATRSSTALPAMTTTTLQATSRQRARALAARAIAKAVRNERPHMTRAEQRALVLQFLSAMVF